VTPTLQQFSAYQAAWEYFNRELFCGELKPCILNFRQYPNSYGIFGNDRWTNGSETVHEISLSPDSLARPVIDTMSTLVHEMCHQWQQDHGDPPRRCYHDKEWASKMEAIGLQPSHTGSPGGKRTGQKMTHFIVEGGPFFAAYQAMPEDIKLPWLSMIPPQEEKEKKPKTRIKYLCNGCQVNVSGKRGLAIVCGQCKSDMIPEDDD